jgi:hypothetical protein
MVNKKVWTCLKIQRYQIGSILNLWIYWGRTEILI